MNTKEATQILWNYNNIKNNTIKPMDFGIILGTNDISHALSVKNLFRDKLLITVIASGNSGKDTIDDRLTESVRIRNFLVKNGIDDNLILLESKATNTGENLQFSFELANSKNINTENVVLISKPYMKRRAYATAKKLFPNTNFYIHSQTQSLSEYANVEGIDYFRFVSALVGDTERIIKYPELGFQITQDYSSEIVQAICVLRNAGYTKYALNYDFCT